jgi:ribonuclease-3
LKKYKTLPVYKLLENLGPRHNPVFKVGVKIHNSKFVYGKGGSKKNAEQKAATLFLKNLGT